MFISLEDLHELAADVAGARHLALLNEVLETPGIGEAREFPAVVDVEESEMIAVGVVEFGFLLVGLLLLFFRAVEDSLDGEHGDDAEHFFGTAPVHRCNEDFGKGWLHRKVGHFAPKTCQESFVIESG